MKKIIAITSAFLFATLLTFASCQQAGYTPPKNVLEAFESRYAGANWVRWEIENSYYVAEFTYQGIKTESWFDTEGKWSMTESDVPFASLPAVVRNSFDASEFHTWAIEDIDKLEREGMETLYVIEVERGEQEMDIYYLENGSHVKTVMHDGHHYQPMDLPAAVQQFIKEKYPTANMIEVDDDKGLLKVDIVENHLKKEVVFDHNNRWVVTKWEAYQSEVPAAVMTTLRESYPQYHIDDIDCEEQANGLTLYIFEIEMGHQEATVYINAQTAQIQTVVQEH